MTYSEIAHEVNKIIGAIPQQERKGMGAINWGDLGVRFIRECRDVWPDTDEQPTVEVLIDEADPSNFEFQNYIYERMVTEFGVHLSIVTEW
jgi:hypothetical protein